MKKYFLFAHVVCKKSKQLIKSIDPIQMGNPNFKMDIESVVKFKNAMPPHAHLIYVITDIAN
jgi:hypothetical protein